jgi:VWFA-related protein
MTKETGGAVFEVKNGQTLEAIYGQIEDLLRSQYSIGYTPDRPAADGKYHKIKLVTKDRHLMVDTRDGYFAK